ncbi:MAG: hypothetical protein AB8H80_08700 [Planctomycetota bacterium]
MSETTSMRDRAPNRGHAPLPLAIAAAMGITFAPDGFAQQPAKPMPSTPPSAPMAETAAPTVSSAASQAYAEFASFCARTRHQHEANAAIKQPPFAALDSYILRVAQHRQQDDGTWRWIHDRRTIAGDRLYYFVPTTGADMLFCVRNDGQAAFSRNEQRVVWDQLEPLFPSALGRGGQDRADDFPQTPTRGNDGNLWLPLSMLATTTWSVTVVDEDDVPMRNLYVSSRPRTDEDERVVRPLPAGTISTDSNGCADLVGLPAHGMGFSVGYGNVETPVASKRVHIDGSSIRLRIDADFLQRARRNANESAAIATLKNICSAQSQCQASGAIDVDRDGCGEFGTFGELSGTSPLRGSKQKMTPPVLSAAFGRIQDGIVLRSGYCFAMRLPDQDGKGLGELANGGSKGLKIDTNNAEASWCAYAWPIDAGHTGSRAFFVNQAGDVLASNVDEKGFSGPTAPPPAGAALLGTGQLSGPVAANRDDRNGRRWIVVR